MTQEVSRRRVLAALGAAGVSVTSGCSGGGKTGSTTDDSAPDSTAEAGTTEGEEATSTEAEGEVKDVTRSYPKQTVDNPVLRPIETAPEGLWSEHLMIPRIPSAYVSDNTVGFDYNKDGENQAEKYGWAIAVDSHSSDDWAWQTLEGNPVVERMNQEYEDPVFWMLGSGNDKSPVYGDLRSHTISRNRDVAVDELDVNFDTLIGLLEGGSGSLERKGDKIFVQDTMSKYGKEDFPIVAGMLEGQSQVVAALEAPVDGRRNTFIEWGGSLEEDGGANARDYVEAQLGILEEQVDPMRSSEVLKTAANKVDELAQSQEYGIPLLANLSPEGQRLVLTVPTKAGESYGGVVYAITLSGETRELNATSEADDIRPSKYHRNRYSA